MGFYLTKKKTKKNEVTIEEACKKSCEVCPLKDSKNERSIRVTGAKDPIILVLGDTPDFDKDSIFKSTLRKVFGTDFILRNVKISSCLKCKKEKAPTDLELACCSSFLDKEIEKIKPLIVLGLGDIPLKMFLGQSGELDWRGRKIPVKYGDNTFWFFPLISPQYLFDKKSKQKFSFKNEFDAVFEEDLYRFKEFLKDENYEDPIVTEDGFTDGIQCFYGENKVQDIKNKLEKFKSYEELAIDIETDGLSCFREERRILTISIGTDLETISFPIYHTEDRENGEEILEIFRDFLKTTKAKLIAHNLSFELSWFHSYFGSEIVWGPNWQDTMLQAYVLDSRLGKRKGHGMLSLDMLVRIYFGFSLKDLSSVNVANLDKEPLKDVLKYNALDVKWTYKLFQKLKRSIKNVFSYEREIKTVKALVLMQAKGILVNFNRVHEILTDVEQKIVEAEKLIYEDSAVHKYIEQYGEFNYSSTPQLVVIFEKILKLPQIKSTPKEKYSVDEEVLEAFEKQGVRLAQNILAIRKLGKLKSTYLDKLLPLDEETVVYSDGKLHPEFSSVFVRTSRLSCQKPNMQNFPKRENKYVRSVIISPENYSIVAMDYGQLEGRVIAVMSEDTSYCEAIKNGYDVHKFWAERMYELWPKVLWVIGCDDYDNFDSHKLEKLRDLAKNKIVFPYFFGSKKKSIQREFKFPDTIMDKLDKEFWEMFGGVKKWQEGLIRNFEKNGYIETLGGQRRRSPLAWNQIINSPVQGTASEIVLESMQRLSKDSCELEKEQYQPIMNIHDDLTFYIPDSELENDVLYISKEMCKSNLGFGDVPLEVEVSVGKNWSDLEKVTKFRTNDFKY